MPRRPGRAAAGAVLALACIVASGCGARLSPRQHAAGVALTSGSGGTATTGPQGVATTAPPDISAPQTGPTAAATGTAPGAVTPTGGPSTGPLGPTGAVGQPSSGTSTAPPSSGSNGHATTTPGSACPAGTLGASDTGVTATTLKIGNSADITGPVPGLFQTAQDGAKAFVAYFNGTNQTVCGRKLSMDTYDSQTSESGDHDAAAAACTRDFALVGSISAYDQGGAPVVQQCGIPDLRSAAVTGARQAVPNTFGAESTSEKSYSSTTPDYFKNKFGDTVTQHAAFLYINVGVGVEQEKFTSAAWKQDGYNYVYEAGIDISDFNYAPFVQTMKSKGVQIVQFIGAEQQAANLMKAIKSQDFHPTAVVLQANTYDAVFPQSAGDAATGAYTYIPGQLFSEIGSNKEAQLYVQWLSRVAPNAQPSFFGEFAWSAMRLFVEQAQKIGPNLTRKAMITALQGVKDWTANGMHAPQAVGAKATGVCESVIQWNGSAWVRVTPAPWTCGRLLASS
ncbi:MAG TPA: ABC transporter substrate-binding protein [Mycobacteriales bacterium]|nr:ABC transporter substrate-binding protein [Mycobacteriales bacterium]